MREPRVTDFRAIVDAVRTTGSVHFPKSSVPIEFVAWRRLVRKAARDAGLSITVARTSDLVLVESREYEISDDEQLATVDVLDGLLTGRSVTYDDALHARRRQRMTLIRSQLDRGDDNT